MKVVIHVDESRKWDLANTNARNILADDDSIEIIMVLYSEPVKLLIDKELILEKGVVYHACKNALNTFNIDEIDLIKGVDVVPSGAHDILKLQADGYLYLKP